ncbi:hypothetical protein SAMD00019534_041890 [Acytostelium subglobosum LB1]|uniref:hypothetical protein n=1 Tax=Acytostelium subglobosum LB1 TaxID=1410327 RepID=UPI000644D792|nr:hypothetical protein SAMD00019534_041890 [Acytostelium subglobosum LB1]GAM21014.1 hypothetical protein SAMD00019534_041890 [Acytostelium subglobosum LB1]|eukprot:XP_012756148.1 hypothetical protein SAMD00019534_041890 [Acytostelium subglobosum LB1]
MGISGLNTFINSNFGNRITVNQRFKYNVVLIDLNNILHVCGRNISNAQQMIEKMNKKLREIVYITKPTELYIAIDGPGPRAKILEQRRRRMGSSLKIAKEKHLKEFHGSKEKDDNTTTTTTATKKKSKMGIDPSLITPGSPLMEDIKNSLRDFTKELMDNPRLAVNKVVISPADSQGEGEWKMFQYINTLPDDAQHRNIAVVSTDSDLILYALSSSKQIHLIIEVRTRKAMDCDILKTELAKTAPRRSMEHVVGDFVFLNLFNGTDYLPKLSGFHFESVWNVYCKDQSTTPLLDKQTNIVDWSFLQRLKPSSSRSLYRYEKSTYKPKVDIINIVHTVMSMAYGCTKINLVPIYEEEEIAVGDKITYTIKMYVNEELIGEGSGEKRHKVKQMLCEPLLDLQHPVWLKYLPMISPDHLKRIQIRLEQRESSSKKPGTDSETAQRFLEGVLWHQAYLSTSVQNYSYYYPYGRAPSFASAAMPKVTNVFLSNDQPLFPLLFNIALSNDVTRNIPKVFHSIYENLPHFDPEQEGIWYADGCMESLEKFVLELVEANRKDLTPFQLSQLEFHPCITIERTGVQSQSNNHYDNREPRSQSHHARFKPTQNAFPSPPHPSQLPLPSFNQPQQQQPIIPLVQGSQDTQMQYVNQQGPSRQPYYQQQQQPQQPYYQQQPQQPYNEQQQQDHRPFNRGYKKPYQQQQEQQPYDHQQKPYNNNKGYRKPYPPQQQQQQPDVAGEQPQQQQPIAGKQQRPHYKKFSRGPNDPNYRKADPKPDAPQ